MPRTSTTPTAPAAASPSPVPAGLLLGMGLGGFFDGIVLHQILQWHHLLSSAGLPPDNLHHLQLNVRADGLFHAATYVLTLAGLALLWRAARRPHAPWPRRELPAAMLAGFGLFNLVEGAVNHHWLGLHHVNETVPPEQWLWWDLGFLAWGAAMLAAGLWMLRRRPVKTKGPGAGLRPEAPPRPRP